MQSEVIDVSVAVLDVRLQHSLVRIEVLFLVFLLLLLVLKDGLILDLSIFEFIFLSGNDGRKVRLKETDLSVQLSLIIDKLGNDIFSVDVIKVESLNLCLQFKSVFVPEVNQLLDSVELLFEFQDVSVR